jgi:hypothetical protein
MLSLVELTTRTISDSVYLLNVAKRALLPPLLKEYIFNYHHENCGIARFRIYWIDGECFCGDCGEAANIPGFYFRSGFDACITKSQASRPKCAICAARLYNWARSSKCSCLENAGKNFGQ